MSIYNTELDDYFCELIGCNEPIPYFRELGAKMSDSDRSQRRFHNMKCAGIHRSRQCNRTGQKPKKKLPLVKSYSQIVCDNWLYNQGVSNE